MKTPARSSGHAHRRHNKTTCTTDTEIMPNVVLTELTAAIAKNKAVDDSAIALITGIADRIKAAVAKAIENGATAEELAPVTDEVNAMNASSDALAAAVVANTPAAEPPTEPPTESGRRR